MFTGIITSQGCLKQFERLELPSSKGETGRLSIQHSYKDIVPGESVAVNGVCLTMIPAGENTMYGDVSAETLRCTALAQLKPNDTVNLERSLRSTDRLGGHFVMGHVDQTGQVTAVDNHQNFAKVTVAGVTEENQPYLCPKGSIALNGTSLTINTISEDSFSVMLIPETRQRTTLGCLKVGDRVNLEFDMLAKYISRQLIAYTH